MIEPIEYYAVLTRYMPFIKLISMLEEGLFIPKANLFSDKWEDGLHLFDGTEDPFLTKEELTTAKDWIYVSCWYADEPETHAMWNSYGNSDNAVAIQTTQHDFKAAYHGSKIDPMCSYVGKVKYHMPANAQELYDNQTIRPWLGNNNDDSKDPKTTYPRFYLFHKHHAFSFEKEARFLLVDNDATVAKRNDRLGIHLSAKYSREMIKKIILHPNCSDWFENTIRKLVKDTYKLDIPIYKSSLVGHKN
ncbi:DUF2971 domain-containing protein [Psychrobacter glacincola]|uniref:DUF2971 domain-containing protein n=1 Tax=Psychrobacter glacincola TaxID=56810 RepID=A0ABW1W2W9_9GAMM|nr:DUF2971 domain-containing protein [Psychrobacter glacincola]